MIKRILVALDIDADTRVATKYAEDIGCRYAAEVVGLAVVDTGSIETGARGAGVGSMYYAEKLRENLTEETRQWARKLIREFDEVLNAAGLEHTESVKEGVPFQRIIEDMKFHDLLLVGREPHFFYGHPQHRTKTLARVVKETAAPTIVVPLEFTPVRRVLIAFDGSTAAARTAQMFVHLLPFGDDIAVEAIHAHQGDERESELMLNMLETYYQKHGVNLRKASMRADNPGKLIADYALDSGVNLVVAGAHSVSKMKELAFGSTTSTLLEKCPTSMFLYH